MKAISNGSLSGKVYDYLRANPEQPFTAAELSQPLNHPKKTIAGELKRLHEGGKIRRSPVPPYSYSWDKTCFLAPL